MGRPIQVQAFMSNVAHDNAEVEDLSIAMLRFPNGALGQITSSVVHHGEEQQFIFQGRHARISAPWKIYASSSKSNGFPEKNVELEEQLQQAYERLPDLPYEGHVAQIDNVLRAIETGEPPLIDGVSGRTTLEMIMAIYTAASTGEVVSLPLVAGDPFYTQAGVKQHAIHFYEKSGHIDNFADQEITTGTSLE